jgi:hypothetical protein
MTIPVPIAHSYSDNLNSLTDLKLPKELASLSFNQSVTNEYIWAIAYGKILPELTILYDGKIHWLADNYEVWEAARLSSYPNLRLKVHNGSEHDALLLAIQYLSISKFYPVLIGEKKRGVLILLADPKTCEWSNLQIANHCSVPELSVAILRKLLYLGQSF